MTKQAGGPQLVSRKAKQANRYASSLTPQMSKLVTEDARARASVQAAKLWNLRLTCVLELRIAEIDRVLAESRARLAAMERRAA